MLSTNARNVAKRLEDEAHHKDDAMQIPAVEAKLLHQIIVAARCRSILEIGVSYGFSTLHLAHAAKLTHGHVHAIEASDKKYNAATRNLEEAGVADYVTIHYGRAQQILPTLRERDDVSPIDFAFIDAVKHESFEYLEAVWPLLADHALIITDNATTHAEELADFIAHLRNHDEIISSATIPIGNGIEVSVRHT